MKRIFNLVLVLVAVFMLVMPAVARAQDNQSLEIYITGLTDDTLKWFRETAFPAFEKENPGVKLEIITGGWGDFDATVAGWFTTGDGPDIVYLGSEYAATYGKLLADMSSYWKEEDLEAFLPAALETATYEGKLRGLPLLMSPRPIFYRTDLVEGEFKAPATFEEAVAFAKENTTIEDNAIVKQGFIDIGNGLFDAQEFIAYIWADGGELYNEDGTSAFDSEATAAALQFMYDRRRAIMPTEDVQPLGQFEGTPLASGKIVSGIFPMWNVPPLTDEIWDNVAIEAYPAGEHGKQIVQVFTDWLSVPEYSENKDLAAKFLTFISSQEMALELNKVAGFTPVRTDAWETIRENKVWDRLLELAQEFGRGFSDIRASAELRPLLAEQVTLFLTDQQSLEDTQAKLKSEYDAILKKNGYIE